MDDLLVEEKIGELVKQNMIAVKLNAWLHPEDIATYGLKVGGTPILFILNTEGKVTAIGRGLQNSNQIISFLASNVSTLKE